MIILLKNTQMPENLGAIARVMKNFGLTQLRLIAPLCDPHSHTAMATSAGAEDILHHAQIFDTLADAAFDVHHLIGTCGDIRQGARVYTSPHALCQSMYQTTDLWGVLFGCERTGLSQADLSHCSSTVRIPTNPAFSSMNISHAVAVLVYALCEQAYDPAHLVQSMPLNTTLATSKHATQHQKDHFFQTLVHMLDDANYWRAPSQREQMMRNLANLFFRCTMTDQEIRTLFGVVRALNK